MYFKAGVSKSKKNKEFIAKMSPMNPFLEKEYVSCSLFKGDTRISQEAQDEIDYWNKAGDIELYSDISSLAPYQFTNGVFVYDAYGLSPEDGTFNAKELLDTTKNKILVYKYNLLRRGWHFPYIYRGKSVELSEILGDKYHHFNISPDYLYQFSISHDAYRELQETAGATLYEIGLKLKKKYNRQVPDDLSDFVKEENIDIDAICKSIFEKYSHSIEEFNKNIYLERVLFDEDSLISEDNAEPEVLEVVKLHKAELLTNGFIVNITNLHEIAEQLDDNEKADIMVLYKSSDEDGILRATQLNEGDENKEPFRIKHIRLRIDKEAIIKSPSNGRNCYMSVLQDEENDDYGYYY